MEWRIQIFISKGYIGASHHRDPFLLNTGNKKQVDRSHPEPYTLNFILDQVGGLFLGLRFEALRRSVLGSYQR